MLQHEKKMTKIVTAVKVISLIIPIDGGKSIETQL